MIGHILDSPHSPVEHGRHVLAQIANAVLYFAMRGERQPWGADDTAFVFRPFCLPRKQPRRRSG